MTYGWSNLTMQCMPLTEVPLNGLVGLAWDINVDAYLKENNNTIGLLGASGFSMCRYAPC
jgi:hypothetical protein